MKARLSHLSAALLLGVFATGAQAAFQSCVGTGYDISNYVTNTTNCTILLPLGANVNDKVQGGNANYADFTVNKEAFFNISDWLFDGKWDNLGESSVKDTSILFYFTGNNQSGTYSYVGSGTFTEIMFVLKDGNGTNLVGYLLDMTKLPELFGNYQSPFVEPPFTFPGKGPKNISHISVYFRGSSSTSTSGGGEVPEPGVLGLLGLGLLGLALARRRA